MPRYAQVQTATGFVVNVIGWDGGFDSVIIPAGYEMVEDTTSSAGAGMTWDGTTFVPAPGLEPKPIVQQDQPAQQPQGRAAPQGLAAPEGWRLSYARHVPQSDYVR
jgi:hypothetical protein